MKNSVLITISLMLFVLVLIGVTIIEPFGKIYPWLQSLTPMIVITGFFTFLVSAALFIYSVINILRNKR